MIIMENFAYIVKRIENAIDHPTLSRYIQKPNIDHDHIWFLYGMFAENGTYANMDDYITSICLVHLALETHDLIRLRPEKNDQERKDRQLTVLAGDFYSAQYYQLLAKQADFPMIKQVSEAIQTINEMKTSFFNQKLPGQRLLELIKNIESTLLLNVAKTLNLPKWNDLISDYFFVTRLIKERQNLNNGQTTKFFHHIIKDSSDLTKGLIQLMDEAIKEGSSRLLNLHQSEFPFVEHLNYNRLFMTESTNVNVLVEEG